jgi:chromosomal replication initiation ATPase DnaA
MKNNYFITPGLKPQLTFSAIEKEILNEFKVNTIQTVSRKIEVCRPRQVCHYFARKYFEKAYFSFSLKKGIRTYVRRGVSLQAIGEYFGNKKHPDILHSIKTVKNDMISYKWFRERIDLLAEMFEKKYSIEAKNF